MSKTLALLKQLIACPSVTPNDAGCQALIAERLEKLGFTIEHLRFEEVDNLWAHHGEGDPTFVFLGHTDVVPPGPEDLWDSPPFEPTIRDKKLYGRGAADMKSGLAAMVTALERYVQHNPNHSGTIGLLVTSDEEGTSKHGIRRVIEEFKQQSQAIDFCVVGEASCSETLGDTIKIGRRGSLNADITIHGKQGHVAYPELAKNPIHLAAPAITEITQTCWDTGNHHFPPTSLQISNMHSGAGANNVIPASLFLQLNFRFSPESTANDLQTRLESILKQHQLNYDIDWQCSGEPFYTQETTLIDAMQCAIKKTLNMEPHLKTNGGTSDGRFVAPIGAEVIEFGPCNKSIHQINEHIRVDDIELLSQVYEMCLKELF